MTKRLKLESCKCKILKCSPMLSSLPSKFDNEIRRGLLDRGAKTKVGGVVLAERYNCIASSVLA